MYYGSTHSPGNRYFRYLKELAIYTAKSSTKNKVQTNDTCDAQGHEGESALRNRTDFLSAHPSPCLTANLLVTNFQAEMYTHLLPMCQSWKMAQWGQFTKQRYFRKASWNCSARGSTERSAFSPHILSKALQSAFFSASNSRPGIRMYNTIFPKVRHMVIYAFSQNLPKLQHSRQAQRWNFSLQYTLKTWSSTVSIPDGKAVFIKNSRTRL